MSNKKQKEASLKRCEHGLGLPIHMKMLLIFIEIGYYTVLILNRALQSNYIALAIGPSWGYVGEEHLLRCAEQPPAFSCFTISDLLKRMRHDRIR